MTPSEYRRALDALSLTLARVLFQLLLILFRPGVSEARRKRLRETVLERIWMARREVFELTTAFMQAQGAEQSGLDDVFIPPMRGYAPSSVDTVVARIQADVDRGSTSVETAASRATSTFVRHAEQAARDAIYDAVYESNLKSEVDPLDDVLDDGDSYGLDAPIELATPENVAAAEAKAGNVARPVAYARGLTGADNCAFCVMLASRGVVYKSASTATDGRFTGKNGGPAYHDNCDCIAVPVYSSKAWKGKSEADRLYKIWLQATKGFSGPSALDAFRRELDRMRREGETIAPNIREAA